MLCQHNFVTRSLSPEKRYTCKQEQFCLLYSGDMSETHVVAGTVFRSVLIWEIESGEMTRQLKGHTGVIFDVAICFETSVASVSDDRSVRFWPKALLPAQTQDDHQEQSIMYGHTARVWRVLPFGNDCLVTSSEDTTIRVWNAKNG